MTATRLIAGLSLLCALVFCAVMAPSASATESTYVTCVKVVTAKTGDFTDEHCKEANAEKKGEFTHEKIATGTTQVTTTNNKTGTETAEIKFKTNIAGAKLEMTATGFMSTPGGATITNTEVAKVMEDAAHGSGTYTGVKVVKPLGCEVEGGKEEVTQEDTKVETVDTGGGAMHLLFKPAVKAAPFAAFKIVGAKCPIKNANVVVAGSAIGIPEGATVKFTTANTEGKEVGGVKSGLFVGPEPAAFETTITTRMAPEAGKPENPISMTTCPGTGCS